jgi:hypothetical protein
MLILAAIASFLLAITLDQLTITNYAGQVSQLGLMLLLSAFFLIVLAGMAIVSRLIIASICDYFSTRQRMERKLLFYKSKQNHLIRLFQFKKKRLLYINQQRRKQLLKKSTQNSVAS